MTHRTARTAPERAVEALRRLVLVAAALCLLGTGGVDLSRPVGGAPAAVAAGASDAGAAARAASGARADQQPVGTAVGLRSVLAAATPVATGDDSAPAPGPHVALHLLARPAVRPPTPSAPPAPADGPGVRGPPAPAGT